MSQIELLDEPKCLRDGEQRQLRADLHQCERMRPLSEFVERVRVERGGRSVPFFDPLDGGVNAQCLFLLEAPGPQAVRSGYVSRNNPDESAKNWFELNAEASIDRRVTIIWNIVPWYIGAGGRIRPTGARDVQEGLPYLSQLLTLLPALRLVVLVGKKAGQARSAIDTLTCGILIEELPHPSPMFVNRKPGNRQLVLDGLLRVGAVLNALGSSSTR